MNSKNLKGLCEAYGGIYAPQELTEEQVWEEVETWVSSLIKEGYDLSDYTWEEMYEAYLEEAPVTGNTFVDRILQGGQAFLQGKPRPSGVVTPEIRAAQQKADWKREALLKSTPGYDKTKGTTLRNNKPTVLAQRGTDDGVMEPGKPETWEKKDISSDEFERYRQVRGDDQMQKDGIANGAARRREETRRREEKPPVPGTQPAGSGSTPPSRPTAGSGSTPPQRPAVASGPVLSKRKGVEGTGVGADFKERAFTAAEKSRYASVAAQNAARTSASSATPNQSPSPSSTPSAPNQSPSPSPSSTSSAPKPAIGVLGKTSFERRTPTSAELRAAQTARAGGASPEKALQAAQKTNLPTTGPSPAIPDLKSVNTDLAKANSPAVINRPAPAGSALAKQQAQQKLKPPTPGTGIMQNQSYEWPSAKTIRDIAGAYASIYEAKKKDQDQDGDNDFADVRVARMIASGMSKAEAIAAVKNKSYNEEVELWVNELLEEGYDLSEYTWDDMFEIYEATAMAKRGYDETEIRNKIAKSTGGGRFADKATALENQPTYGNKSKKAARQNLARKQRGDFRRTTSSNPGLHGYAYKSNDPAVKAKQAARGAQRGVLTPNEKKELNREAYETYEFVASYLLENNFANTVEDANVIINNMSEGWFESIMEG